VAAQLLQTLKEGDRG